MRFAITYLLALLSAGASAEPHAFKTIKLGADQAEYAQDARFNCQTGTTPLSDVTCTLKHSQRETLAERPIRVLALHFYDGRLYVISALFKSDDYRTIAHALTERYGEQFERRDNTVTNRAGASFNKETRRWQGPESHIEIQQYAGTLDQGVIHFRLNDYLDQFTERHKRKTKGAAKDL